MCKEQKSDDWKTTFYVIFANRVNCLRDDFIRSDPSQKYILVYVRCVKLHKLSPHFKDFHCTVLTRAQPHGMLAGRCELQCVDCASLEEWFCHLHVCGGISDFLVISVLNPQ